MFYVLRSVSVFAVGLRFVYWAEAKEYEHLTFKEDPALFIEGPKYENIKEEVLESGKCTLFAFKVVAAKCSELMLCGKVRGTFYNQYWINEGDPLRLHHVQCVVVYCDLTDLSSAFTATFRPEFVGESLESINERNQRFYHISKCLREAVECFGKNGRKYGGRYEVGPFYCGMNCLLLLTQFGIERVSLSLNFRRRTNV